MNRKKKINLQQTRNKKYGMKEKSIIKQIRRRGLVHMMINMKKHQWNKVKNVEKLGVRERG